MRHELEKKRQNIILDITNACIELSETRDLEALAKEDVAITKQNLIVGIRQLKLGAVSIQQIAEYNMKLSEAKRRHANALIDHEKAKIKLTWASGE